MNSPAPFEAIERYAAFPAATVKESIPFGEKSVGKSPQHVGNFGRLLPAFVQPQRRTASFKAEQELERASRWVRGARLQF